MIEPKTIFGTELRYPERRIREGEGYVAFIKTADTLRYAWRELQSTKGSFLAVTDRRLKFKGILTRDAVEDILLDALALPGERPAARTPRSSPPRHLHAR